MHRLLLLALVLAFCTPLQGARSQQSQVARAKAAGPTLEQQRDGSCVQTISLHGVALPGLAGLRHAFTAQSVAVTCPSSSEFWVSVSGGRQSVSAQGGSAVSWQWRRHCGAGSDGSEQGSGATVAPLLPGTCSVGVPAMGDSVITLQQPGEADGAGSGGAPPDPCTLTVQPHFSALLLALCAAGAALLLRGQAWMRSRPAVALVRASCILVPLATAACCVALLASITVLSTAVLELLLTHIPVSPPKELWGTVVVAMAAVAGIGTGLSLICACMAVQLRPAAVAAAPWLAQLLGLALVCSNCQALNWLVRGACCAWLLRKRVSRPRAAPAPGPARVAAGGGRSPAGAKRAP